jgi:hypothetical protein
MGVVDGGCGVNGSVGGTLADAHSAPAAETTVGSAPAAEPGQLARWVVGSGPVSDPGVRARWVVGSGPVSDPGVKVRCVAGSGSGVGAAQGDGAEACGTVVSDAADAPEVG